MEILKGELDDIDYGFISDQNSNTTTLKYKLDFRNILVKIWSLAFLAEWYIDKSQRRPKRQSRMEFRRHWKHWTHKTQDENKQSKKPGINPGAR